MARLLPNGRPAGPMSQSRLALAKNIRENAFANREFSSPAPKTWDDPRIPTNRTYNFNKGTGDFMAQSIIEPVKSAVQITNELGNRAGLPRDTIAQGLGEAAGSGVSFLQRTGKLSGNRGTADYVKRLVEAKASGEVTPMDAINAAAFIPFGKAGAIGANLVEKGVPVVVPFAAGGMGVMRVGGRGAKVGIDMDKEIIKAEERLAGTDWVPGKAHEFDSVQGVVEHLNWGPYKKYRALSRTAADKGDITYLDPSKMSAEELDKIGTELHTDDPISALTGLKATAQAADQIIRGGAEPTRLVITKIPDWKMFNSRMSSERFSGWTKLPMEKRKEVYQSAVDWLNNNDAYWRIQRRDPETGKTVATPIGGVDMEHHIHYAKGGRGVKDTGEVNASPGLSGPNRMQGDVGIGGQVTGGFDKFLESEIERRHNKAAIYTFGI